MTWKDSALWGTPEIMPDFSDTGVQQSTWNRMRPWGTPLASDAGNVLKGASNQELEATLMALMSPLETGTKRVRNTDVGSSKLPAAWGTETTYTPNTNIPASAVKAELDRRGYNSPLATQFNQRWEMWKQNPDVAGKELFPGNPSGERPFHETGGFGNALKTFATDAVLPVGSLIASAYTGVQGLNSLASGLSGLGSGVSSGLTMGPNGTLVLNEAGKAAASGAVNSGSGLLGNVVGDAAANAIRGNGMDWLGLAKDWGPTVIGGLLGGSEAGKSQTTTTQSGPPAWALPYLQGIAQEGANLYGQGGGIAPFSPDTLNAFGQMRGLYNVPSFDQTGLQQLQSTASGAEMNPYLDRVTGSALDDIENRVNSQFSAAGRYGSGAHTQALAREMGDVSARMRIPLYEAERGRQMTAAQKLPFAQGQFLQNQAFAPQMGLGIGQQIENKGQQMLDYPWTNLSRYSSILQGIPFGTNQTQTVPGGSFTSGLLGGALVGNRIGDNLFNSNMA